MSTRENLKPVDFSDGIREDEINEHFDSVNEQLRRERLYVAGSGVMSGLNFSASQFMSTTNNVLQLRLNISEGSVVDFNGDEVFFSDAIFTIDAPKLIPKTETVVLDDNGTATLLYAPYATTRATLSELDLPNSGVTTVDADNITRKIAHISIQGTKVQYDAKNKGKRVTISYSYALKRYDLVYIDNNYDIKILQGLSSSSPSVPMPKSTVVDNTTVQGYKYILGYILVDPIYTNLSAPNPVDRLPHANILVTKEYKNLRNIYTDEANGLYICGTPFKDLQIIHMDKPQEPVKENTLWYDAAYNKLKIYRTVDGISDWQLVNDLSVIPVMEYLIWTHDELDTASKLPLPYRHDLQTFKFADKGEQDALRMKFVPGRNELEIIIDNILLMHDQYVELTDEDVSGDYENTGIGFKLVEPLDHAADIEVRVVHRVWESDIDERFQRSATFVATDSFDYLAENGLTVTTKSPYRYHENQLEVFVDGVRMDVDKDYYEGTDLLAEQLIKGTMSSQFTFKSLSPSVKRISYKITTSIYSYDHINKILGNLDGRMAALETSVSAAINSMNDMENTITNQINTMQDTVDAISMNTSDMSGYVMKTDVLDVSNMPQQITSATITGFISKSVTFSAASGSLNIPISSSTKPSDVNYLKMSVDVSPTDYIEVFDISSPGGNKILKRRNGIDTDYDYDIVIIGGVCYLALANNNIVQDGHILYITGLKLGGVS